MIKRCNYTKRKKILLKDVKIKIEGSGDQFGCCVDLSGLSTYNLPTGSPIYIEAYRQALWKRFSCGNIGNEKNGLKYDLSLFEVPDGLKFRAKVVSLENKKIILAEADQIKADSGDIDDNAPSLLPLKPQELGEEVYKIAYGPKGPIMLINKKLGNIKEFSKSPIFSSLVYPSAFKEILIKIFLIDKFTEDSDREDWRSRWIKLIKDLPGIGDIPDVEDTEYAEDAEALIDRVINVFSKKFSFATTLTEKIA